MPKVMPKRRGRKPKVDKPDKVNTLDGPNKMAEPERPMMNGVAVDVPQAPREYPRPVYQETKTIWSTGKVTTEKTTYPREY